ncbi:MAG: hypothetical protein N0E48_23450, partial [Candidatus Thiodiazotropha endolucinida]|nr:hypothetical protein [Candidatus Thiodiazotropha taylori]MCW4346289.1 hypothetical protein [Candidatus Thiodiazotropha endolucinida]
QSITNKIDLMGIELRIFFYYLLGLTKIYLTTPYYNGGMCVYIKDNVFSRRWNDLELPNIECIWVEVTVHHRNFLIGTVYRPPKFPFPNHVCN